MKRSLVPSSNSEIDAKSDEEGSSEEEEPEAIVVANEAWVVVSDEAWVLVVLAVLHLAGSGRMLLTGR